MLRVSRPGEVAPAPAPASDAGAENEATRAERATPARGTVLVYGAGANQVPVLEACRRASWRTIAIDRDPHAPGAGLADRFLCRSLRETDRIRATLAAEPIEAVVARVTDHEALFAAATLARERGLPGPCPDLVEAATRKTALARHCARAGVATPRRLGREGAAEFLAGGVVIVRPDITVRGKAGITRVDRGERLAAALAEARRHSANGGIDLSEWVDGADVSVLARLEGGRARRLTCWDEWVALDEAGGVRGLGVAMPSIVEDDGVAGSSIDEALARLAAGFRRSRGLVVLSFRVDLARRAQLIEIHLGLGGDGIAEQLLPAALPGWDALATWVEDQAGRVVTAPATRCRPAALLREGRGWQLVEAATIEILRARARARLPTGWRAPLALREGPIR